VVANHPSGFFTLAAAPRQPLAVAAWPTSPRKTRVRDFRRRVSGQTSSRRRCRSINTPGSRGCGYKTVSGRHEWLNRDPIGERGGINLYDYVGNNPVNFVDPFGLSQQDVNSILSLYNQSIQEMIDAGHRVPDPFSPLSSLKYWYPGNGWDCKLQSAYLGNELYKASKTFDDRWTIQNITTFHHSWVEATSSNPSDPSIRLDPWWGNVSQQQPTISSSPGAYPPISNTTVNNIPTVPIPPFSWGRTHP